MAIPIIIHHESMVTGKTIKDANIKALKEQYRYDTLSLPNKKVVDKKIKEAIKNLHLTIKTTAIVLDRIDKSMRNTLGDLVTDELIDKLDAVLSDLELEKLLTLRK